jgi:hypothetical protein
VYNAEIGVLYMEKKQLLGKIKWKTIARAKLKGAERAAFGRV